MQTVPARVRTLSLGLFLACGLAAATPPLMAGPHMVDIRPVPPGAGVNSGLIYVGALGDLRVQLTVRTAALFNTGGRSTYLVSLRRGMWGANGAPAGTELLTRRAVTDSQKVGVELVVPIRNCSEAGEYHVRVSNVSTENPQMGIVGNVTDGKFVALTPDVERRHLDLVGVTVIDLDRGAERTVSIGSFPRMGAIALTGKWHVPGIIPSYRQLRIDLMRPDGTVAKGGRFFSYHAPYEWRPKMAIGHTVTDAEAKQSGSWKLRIVNSGDTRIEGFNIQQGSDPLASRVKSTFTTACGA